MSSPSSILFSISRSYAADAAVATAAPFPVYFLQPPTAASNLVPRRPSALLPKLKYHPSKPLLRHFLLPFAISSSFAEAEEDETLPQKDGDPTVSPFSKDGEQSEMARAFGISSKAASGACACLVLAALTFPLAMRSVTSAATAKVRVLSYVTLLSGFYMAWNIGANDVANAMGTSVGSGALSLWKAVVIAAVLEFSGALLMGTHVTSTMQKGILVASVFQGKDLLLFAGLLSSLASAGTWLQVASFYGWPVSTTHCIVGAMVGFGLVYGGLGAVFWSSLARVTSSWVISPAMGAAASFIVYKCIRRNSYFSMETTELVLVGEGRS